MNTYNSRPYYDDFDEKNNFYQIMFRPEYAVQARELTQLQTILRDQIQKFGNHIFKHGSVVIPGNAYTDLSVPCIKVENTFNGNVIGPATFASKFEGKIIVGQTSGLKAIVRKAVTAVDTDPMTLYLSYIDGGGTNSTSRVFIDGEDVCLETDIDVGVTVKTNGASIGSMVFINPGVFYIRGSFVYIESQSAILNKYSTTPSCHVFLRINESIISDTDDSTLLDPAQGSYNYAAPGANRVKIWLDLVIFPLNTTIDDNYVELMRYSNGVLLANNRYPQYSELEKSLARRTYDESGDYIVSGFQPSIREHLKTLYNSGVFTDGDRDKFVVDIAPGKGYLGGFETEVIAPTRLELDRARTAIHEKIKPVSLSARNGSYIYVSDLKGLPDFRICETVDLYNDNDATNGAATKVGTAIVTAIDYYPSTSSTVIYKLYYNTLALTSSYTLNSVGGIRFVSGSATVLTKYTITLNSVTEFAINDVITSGTKSATVKRFDKTSGTLYVYKHDHTKSIPILGDIITVGSASGTIRKVENAAVSGPSALLFKVPVSPIKSLTNELNDFDLTYNVLKTFTSSTDNLGNLSYTITDGAFRTPEVGATVVVGPTDIVDISLCSLTGSDKTFNITDGPHNASITVCTQVLKTAIQPKVKTLVTNHTLTTASASVISLGKADIFQLISVIEVNTGVDVTDRYRLDNGQTDSYYGLGKLYLNGVAPTGNVTITFDYFTHSNSGDCFTIDSYATLGVDYIARVPSYRSPTSSVIYNLGSYIDFRPRVDDTGAFSGGTASLSDVPLTEGFINTSVTYYLPRIDVVYLDKAKYISYITGVPNENPVAPNVPINGVELFTLKIPAYTKNITSIVVKRAKNNRFTMQDINNLKTKINDLEYYSTLTALEDTVVNYQIVDPSTGLNRYKTGYLVDNFNNPFKVCDFYNADKKCDFIEQKLTVAKEGHDSAMVFNTGTSTHYQITGRHVSLPYIETPFISQTTSTRITNINPYMVFAWTGNLSINPSSDSWIETEYLPTIYNTVDEVITITREERVEVQVPPVIIPVPVIVPEPVKPPPIVVEQPVPVVEPTSNASVGSTMEPNIVTYTPTHRHTASYVSYNPFGQGETIYYEYWAYD